MSSPTVAHLHVHSEYSLLDGACKIDKLAERAAEFGQPAIGLTDHGVMNGAVELYKAAKKHGVKPMLGLEAYFVDDRTRARPQGRAQPPDAARAERRGLPEPHQALERRASSRACTAASRASTWSCSSQHAEGVIALTGCLAVAHEPADRRRASSTRPARTWTSSSRSSAPRTSTSRSRRTA